MTDYTLKFLFANHDGVQVDIQFPETATGAMVKDALINQHWPEDKIEKVSSPAGIRLLTMGKMMEDGKTLADMKIPKYDHATPVNVSLLPKGKTYSENPGGGSNSTSHKTAAGAANNGGGTSGVQPAPAACCTIC